MSSLPHVEPRLRAADLTAVEADRIGLFVSSQDKDEDDDDDSVDVEVHVIEEWDTGEEDAMVGLVTAVVVGVEGLGNDRLVVVEQSVLRGFGRFGGLKSTDREIDPLLTWCL